MNNKPFSEIFQDRVDDIYRRAKNAGVSVTALCRGAGTARATPDRWRTRLPMTVTLVDDLEAELAKHEQKAPPAGN